MLPNQATALKITKEYIYSNKVKILLISSYEVQPNLRQVRACSQTRRILNMHFARIDMQALNYFLFVL